MEEKSNNNVELFLYLERLEKKLMKEIEEGKTNE